jgi:hypothetical protein
LIPVLPWTLAGSKSSKLSKFQGSWTDYDVMRGYHLIGFSLQVILWSPAPTHHWQQPGGQMQTLGTIFWTVYLHFLLMYHERFVTPHYEMLFQMISGNGTAIA